MRFLPLTFLAPILAISLVGCTAPAGDETSDSQESGYTGRRSRAPLSGDELRFQKYLHVDESTGNWPSHDYAEYSRYASANGKRYGVDAALYLEADRTFTLYYSEIEMVDQYNGHAITQRKLTGTWRANGATLELGSTASATTAMTEDWFGHDTEGLVIVLPSGWASSGLASEIPLIMGGSNVGPNAPFWSDYR